MLVSLERVLGQGSCLNSLFHASTPLITSIVLGILSQIPFTKADRVDDYVFCMKQCVEEVGWTIITCDGICGAALRAAQVAGTLTREEWSKFLNKPN